MTESPSPSRLDPAAFIARGRRVLDAEGNLAPDPGDTAGLAGPLFIVDLEMSGPNAAVHEILDIGIVTVRLEPRFPEAGSWGSRVKPKRIGNAERGALRVVRYSAKKWRDACSLEEGFAEVQRLAQGAVLTGWGLESDVAFLRYTYAHLGLEWNFAEPIIDIQAVARAELRGADVVDRYNLGHVADRLQIGRMGEHGALADAFATYDVLVKLWERATGM